MEEYQSNFRRYEKKYLLDREQITCLYHLLSEDFQEDEHGENRIFNIYFDTASHLMIRQSLEKPAYKEKLRLRSYRLPRPEDPVFIELKKKFEGVVYKRRIEMAYRDAVAYLYERRPAPLPSQITREIDWTLHFYQGIEPKMYISYDRLALFAKDDPSLRITFDSHIRWRETDLFLEKESPCKNLFSEGQYLMEIKVPGAMPLWLSHVLDDLDVYPVSFSKYGEAYLKTQTGRSPYETPVTEYIPNPRKELSYA